MAKQKSFEQAIEELEGMVKKLENGELSLDDSIKCFQEGIELSRFCNKRLDEVEQKITVLLETKDGNIIEQDINKGE